jgi:hypothetical protein
MSAFDFIANAIIPSVRGAKVDSQPGRATHPIKQTAEPFTDTTAVHLMCNRIVSKCEPS